jgi:DNA-binding GntR family transcriptional regulator
VLADALAVLECRVSEAVRGGTHRVFLSLVQNAEAREGSPLAYFRGKFGRFELAQDAKVYEQLRRQILDGVLPPDRELDPDELAVALGTGVSSVHYALTRLIGEGLVVRSAERGYTVTPLDAARSDDAFDARLAIELGAAELTVGKLSTKQLSTLRERAAATVPELDDGHLVDVDAYVRASAAFHLYLVQLTGSIALEQAYERLSIADLMTRALAASASVKPDMAEEHLRLVAAFEQADLGAVRQLIIEHTMHAKANQRADLATLKSRSHAVQIKEQP